MPIPVQCAKPYRGHEIENGPLLVEDKLDGIRCGIVVSLKTGRARSYSRGGNLQRNMEAILEEIEETLSRFNVRSGTRVLVDGEAYIDRSWRSASGLLRAQNLKPKHYEAMERLRLHVFDVVALNGGKNPVSQTPQNVRTARVAHLFGACAHIIPVPSIECRTAADVKRAYNAALERGREGVMLKQPAGIYRCAVRSSDWLKLKPFTTSDGRIIGFVEGNGRLCGTLGALRVRLKDGRSVRVGNGMCDAQRNHIWRSRRRLKGAWVEIRHQKDKHEVAVCRFNSLVRIRGDRDW